MSYSCLHCSFITKKLGKMRKAVRYTMAILLPLYKNIIVKINFRKYKVKGSFFSKSVDQAEVRVFSDRFEIRLSSFVLNSGVYYIESITEKTKVYTEYRVKKRDFSDESELDSNLINSDNYFNLFLNNDRRKISVVKDNQGFILKSPVLKRY